MQFAGHHRFHEKHRTVYNIFNVLLFMMSVKPDTFIWGAPPGEWKLS